MRHTRAWHSPTLVGVERTQQFEALVGFAEHAWDGEGHVVLLAGEAGAGKTRLIRETRQLAARRHVRVLEGVCFEPDRGVPLAPMRDLLRPLLREAAPEVTHQPSGVTAADLSRMLSEPGAAGYGADPDEHKRRVFAALFTLIQDLAEAQPLLLILEDLHWADDASLEFVRLLARRAAELPALILISYRLDETAPTLAHTLADLQRQRLATELVLGPLSRSDTEVMLRAILQPRQAFGAGVVDRIFALTEGNPFFVEEVLGSLIAADDATTLAAVDRLAVPRTIQDAVQRRVELIGAEAHQVLVLASVLGRGFDFRILEHVTGASEVRLLELVRELIAVGLVAEESAERFVFRHALTQQAVYGELLGRERRALHRRVLETLEQFPPAAHGGAGVDDLAYHAHAAADWPKALDYCLIAGDHALAMHAPGAAVEHFLRAIDAGEQLGLAPPAAVLRGRSQAYETLGAFDLARSDLEAMVQAAQAAADRAVEWQALLDLGFLWAARDYARARAYLDAALAIARTFDDVAPLAQTLNRLGNWYMNADAPHDAVGYHKQALSIFERLGDAQGAASTLDLLGLAESLAGQRDTAAAHYARAERLFRQLGDRRGLVSALSMLSWLGQGDPSETIMAPESLAAHSAAHADEAIELARGIGWRAGEAYALGQGALLQIGRGQYARALDMARGALSIADEIEHRQWALMAHLSLGRVMAELLAWQTATAHFEQARALAETCGSVYFGRIALASLAGARGAQGQLAEAQALLETLADLVSFADPVHRSVWRVRAEVALAGRQPAASLEIVDRLIASAEAAGSAPNVTLPALALLRGRALLELGQLETAAMAMQAARQTAEQRGLLPLVWRAQLGEGQVWRRQGRRLEAAAMFAAARATIERLAADVPTQAIAEAERAGLRDHFLQAALAQLPHPSRVTPTGAAKQAAGGLTAREREVARLLSAGKSNAAIAAELVLGRRTVETHVANIYAKLGVSSRAQVAAWAVENLRKPPDKTP